MSPSETGPSAPGTEDSAVIDFLVHDLGNLLTPLPSALDYLSDGVNREDPEALESLHDLQESEQRLRIFKEMALLAEELRRHPGTTRHETVPVAAVMTAAHRLIERRAEAKRATLSFDVPAVLQAVGARTWLSLVASALADGLVTRLPTGGRLALSAAQTAEGVEIVCAGSHAAVPEVMGASVFDRAGEGRLRAHKHLGCQGLNFHAAYLMARAMGGSLSLESREDWATCLVLRLRAP